MSTHSNDCSTLRQTALSGSFCCCSRRAWNIELSFSLFVMFFILLLIVFRGMLINSLTCMQVGNRRQITTDYFRLISLVYLKIRNKIRKFNFIFDLFEVSDFWSGDRTFFQVLVTGFFKKKTAFLYVYNKNRDNFFINEVVLLNTT